MSYKLKCSVVGFPSPLQFGAHDSGFSFLGETGNNQFVDVTEETYVELRLPLEVDMEPDQIREHVPIFPGPADLDAVYRIPGTQRQNWPRYSQPGTLWAVTGGRSTSGRIRGWSS